MRDLSKTIAVAAVLTLATAASPHAQPTAGPAKPVSSAVTGDIRCLLTMAALGQDKSRQQVATIGAYFFMGRISARAPGLDVPAAVKAEAAKLSGQSLNAEAKRCGPLMEGAMRALQVSFGGPRPATPGAPSAPLTAPTPAPAPSPMGPPLPK